MLGAGGAVLLMVAHGLSVALLFLLGDAASTTARRPSTLAQMGGLAQKAPVLAAFFVAATLASIGLPGFANFWGEFTIFVALWHLLAVDDRGRRRRASSFPPSMACARSRSVFFGPPTEAFPAGDRGASAGRPPWRENACPR